MSGKSASAPLSLWERRLGRRCVAVFLKHRDEIERAASEKYDAGQIEKSTDAMVVIAEVGLSIAA